MTSVKNVAIVGATGTIGKVILAELLKAGKHDVTAITRASSQAMIPDGVRIAKVNYDDHASLVAALHGQQVLIITMNPLAPNGTQQKLIEAAADADVAYIFPNGWGRDPSHPSSDDAFLGPGQRAIQKRIEELGKSSWIQFVSGAWYEFSLGSADRFGFDFQNRSVTFFDDGSARINTSTWDQTGRAVAKVLSLRERPDGKGDDGLTLSSLKNSLVYFSSFLVSQKDMFESVLRVTGTTEEEWKVSHENSTERYQKGLEMTRRGEGRGFERTINVRLFYPEGAGNGSGAFEPIHGLYNDALGLPREDLDERTKIAIDRSKELSRSYS